uniref:Uncharacterized protein n=1 Tax=Oryza nivara TaxID=4536 RepID=A0A0E0FIK0_ORYNI
MPMWSSSTVLPPAGDLLLTVTAYRWYVLPSFSHDAVAFCSISTGDACW